MFKAPMIPQIKDGPTKDAADEIARVAVGLKDKIAHGVMSEEVDVPAIGNTFSVQHKLGRKPTGWMFGRFYGATPRLQVTSVDAKRINMISMLEPLTTTRFAFWVW